MASIIPLIVITGPTASGKTGIALDLAAKYGGEIICADSRTVYTGLSIGTAKPTVEERRRVPHHLLDVVEPDEPYNLARFQAAAREAIDDIRSRGKVPFLVGGSGLYIDSIVLNYSLGCAPDLMLREFLNGKSVDELRHYCIQNNIDLPDNSYNRQYLIRSIEQRGTNRIRQEEPDSNTIMVAIRTDGDVLKTRIKKRAEGMFNNGLIAEAEAAANTYGWDVPPLKAPAYGAVRRLINNEISYDQAVDALARSDWQLARKQMTWLRRHSWLSWREHDQIGDYIDTQLMSK